MAITSCPTVAGPGFGYAKVCKLPIQEERC
jgi:hypothetical protein